MTARVARAPAKHCGSCAVRRAKSPNGGNVFSPMRGYIRVRLWIDENVRNGTFQPAGDLVQGVEGDILLPHLHSLE